MEELKGKKVLVVDDLSMIRKVLRKHLEIMDMEVVEAPDAETVLELVHKEDFDAFLLDIHLPGMDGIELCRCLRIKERFKHTPILFITSLEEERVLEAAFSAGGDDVIGKPVSYAVLEARLINHLRRMDYSRQLDYLQRNLNLYVCPRTLEMVEKQAKTGQVPPPEEREVCVLFSDVRGFTQLSQEIEPKSLFDVLSEHLGAQVKSVYRYGGYIDKFSGDGLMAVFDGPDMVIKSCLCALKIIEQSRELCGSSSACIYQLGIGIHKGSVLIGNIGTEKQLDYTVIGPTVNLAARLCGHADALSVVVSDAVKEALAGDLQIEFSKRKDLNVKGVKEPVAAYNISQGERARITLDLDDMDD